LGQRIVRELGLEDGNDTLGRWMAHRIAELMEKSEQADDEGAREESRRECSDLILRVWSRRSSWPYGQPLAHVASVLKGLAAEPNPYGRRRREPEERSWPGVIPSLDELLEDEQRLYRDAAVAGVPKEESEAWLEDHKEEMSEEEIDSLESLLKLIERRRAEFSSLAGGISLSDFGALPEEERNKHLLEALGKLDTERFRLREMATSPEVPDEADEEGDTPTE
jgi:hypothetical protein